MASHCSPASTPDRTRSPSRPCPPTPGWPTGGADYIRFKLASTPLPDLAEPLASFADQLQTIAQYYLAGQTNENPEQAARLATAIRAPRRSPRSASGRPVIMQAESGGGADRGIRPVVGRPRRNVRGRRHRAAPAPLPAEAAAPPQRIIPPDIVPALGNARASGSEKAGLFGLPDISAHGGDLLAQNTAPAAPGGGQICGIYPLDAFQSNYLLPQVRDTGRPRAGHPGPRDRTGCRHSGHRPDRLPEAAGRCTPPVTSRVRCWARCRGIGLGPAGREAATAPVTAAPVTAAPVTNVPNP